MDTFTSLLAGVTVFAVIGNLMEENGLKEEEIQGGPGLTFVLVRKYSILLNISVEESYPGSN